MELHHTVIGDEGPLVAFCHGVFGQGKNWTRIAKNLAAGDKPHRSLLIDMPNHGRSEWSDEMNYPMMAEEVAALLREHADGPIDIVGHSMGGKAVMQLALRHPEVVNKLCVVDISPVAYPRGREFERFIAGMQSLDLSNIPDRATADAQMLDAAPNYIVRSFLLQNLRREHVPGEPPSWHWMMNLDVIAESFSTISGWPGAEGLTPFDGPVLWIAGADSNYVEPEYAEPMRALFPRTRQFTIKDAGHWVHSEQPDIFTAALRHFLDS